MESQLVESITRIATVKRFGIEQFTNTATENRFVSLLKTVYRATLNAIYTSNAHDFVAKLFTVILLWVGGYFVIQQEITAGELMSFYALIGYFTEPAGQLITANKSVQEALIAADRLFEIMDLEREENTEKIDLSPELLGDIRFQDVSFRYGTRTQVFENLNLLIPSKKITAIVGESGCGKSTLISLLQNLYPLQSGNINIGSFNIQHIKNDNLRKHVVVVPQQIDLFAGSILENIALGEYMPDVQRILAISEELGITQFVEKMPQGFGTYIGENGTTLSGGQRQRLAIARALYKNPEILILDEATSSLDSISEQYIQKAIQKLRLAEKTIIVIAHRLSTIKIADKIIVLENGKLVGEGQHATLLEQNVSYKNLWQQQFENFS